MTNLEADLRRAKLLLEERGWLPMCGRDDDGPMCVLNAARECTYGIGLPINEQKQRTDDVVSALVVAGNFVSDIQIADWNDSLKSIEPVIALFDKAIAAQIA